MFASKETNLIFPTNRVRMVPKSGEEILSGQGSPSRFTARLKTALLIKKPSTSLKDMATSTLAKKY